MQQQIDVRPLLQDHLPPHLPDDILMAMNNPSPQTLVCPVCGIEKQIHHFSQISEKCQQIGHSFCFDCIYKELIRCIDNNEEVFCIIDACPHKISETQAFLSKLPKDINDKYARWKKSSQYRNRRKTMRMSFHDRRSYHLKSKIQPSQLIEEEDQEQKKEQFYLVEPEEPIVQDKNQLKNGNLNGTEVKTDVSEQEIDGRKKNKKSHPRKGKIRQQKEVQQEDKMPIKAYQDPAPRREQASAPRIPHKNNFRTAYEQRPYTFFRLVGKIILLVFGLPIVIAQGIVFLCFAVTFYLLFVFGFLSVFASFAGAFYFCVYEPEKFYLGFLYFLGTILGIGLFRLFLNISTTVRFLCIRNMWILWRRQIRMICSYPDLPYYVRS